MLTANRPQQEEFDIETSSLDPSQFILQIGQEIFNSIPKLLNLPFNFFGPKSIDVQVFVLFLETFLNYFFQTSNKLQSGQ